MRVPQSALEHRPLLAPPIPALLIESHVLRHLDSFVGSVEELACRTR